MNTTSMLMGQRYQPTSEELVIFTLPQVDNHIVFSILLQIDKEKDLNQTPLQSKQSQSLQSLYLLRLFTSQLASTMSHGQLQQALEE